MAPGAQPCPPRMAFLGVVACLALARTVPVKCCPQAQGGPWGAAGPWHPRDGDTEPPAQAAPGGKPPAFGFTLVPLCLSRRLQSACQQPLGALQQEDHQRANAVPGSWPCGYATIPLPGQGQHPCPKQSKPGRHPGDPRHPPPVPSICGGSAKSPQLFVPNPPHGSHFCGGSLINKNWASRLPTATLRSEAWLVPPPTPPPTPGATQQGLGACWAS